MFVQACVQRECLCVCEKYSSHPIFTNQLPNFAEVIVGEDKSDVSLDTR